MNLKKLKINGKERLNYSLGMSWIFSFLGIVDCIFRRDVREIKYYLEMDWIFVVWVILVLDGLLIGVFCETKLLKFKLI